MTGMLSSLYQSMVIMAAPLVLASMGGLVTYHAGIVNVAMEGMMLSSAFAAVVLSYLTGSAYVGMLAAIMVSIMFSMLYSFFVTTLKTNNFAIGIAVNILVSSLTLFLTRIMFKGQDAFNSIKIAEIPKLNFATGIEFIDTIFFGFSILVYFAIVITLLISYMIYKTPFGLWVRAAGSYPEALSTAGKKLSVVQYTASAITGALCGLAGAQLSLSNVVMFTRDMTAGRGFICLAVILISRGKPKYAFTIAVLFGLFNALSIQLQAFKIPTQFLFMIPYLMAVVALFLMDTAFLRKKNSKRSESV